MVEFTIYTGERLSIPIPLTNADGTPYKVTGTVVLRVAARGEIHATVEEEVSITDPDTPTIEFDGTGDLLGFYLFQVIETEQPLVLVEGRLNVRQMIESPDTTP